MRSDENDVLGQLNRAAKKYGGTPPVTKESAMIKRLRCSKTVWFALLLPPVSWLIQWKNGGILPVSVQTWGPLLVTIGMILLRLATGDYVCHFTPPANGGRQPPGGMPDNQGADAPRSPTERVAP